MDLRRRLTLYLFGLIIGGGIAYWTYGERLTSGAWLPEAKVKSRLRSTLLKATPTAQLAMEAKDVDLEMLRASMDSARVDFGSSSRGKDSLIYAVRTRLRDRELMLRVSTMRDFDRDSTATLLELR